MNWIGFCKSKKWGILSKQPHDMYQGVYLNNNKKYLCYENLLVFINRAAAI